MGRYFWLWNKACGPLRRHTQIGSSGRHGVSRLLRGLGRVDDAAGFGGDPSGVSFLDAHRIAAFDANQALMSETTRQSNAARKVFRSSYRLRLEAIVPCVVFAFMLWPDSPIEIETLISGMVGYMLYFVCALLAVYYLVWVFRYEVEIDGARLRYRDFTLKLRDYDLNELVRVRRDGRYVYVLTFAGNHSTYGGFFGAHKAHIFKGMTESQELKNRLLDFLEQNRKI